MLKKRDAQGKLPEKKKMIHRNDLFYLSQKVCSALSMVDTLADVAKETDPLFDYRRKIDMVGCPAG